MSESGQPTDRVPRRADLTGVQPYGAPQFEVPVRLNSNETPQAPPRNFLEEVARRLPELDLHRYPDRPHRVLRARLGQLAGLGPDQVWAANGSNEVLLQLLQAYGGPDRRALTFRPGYSMYPELARTALTPITEVDLDETFGLPAAIAADAVRANDPDLVLVASPNNPVGTLVGHDAIRALHQHSRALVVVDEAYIEFAPHGSSVVDLLQDLPRLAMVRTFSKAFRLAGLRLGYLYAAPWVVDDVQTVRLPYHLDAIKQMAATVALDQVEGFLDHRENIASERDRVYAVLAAREDVEVWPSAANFLLLRTQVPNLFDRLLGHGVLVRDFSDKPRLAGCLRVTIGTPEENDAFLDGLVASLAEAADPDPAVPTSGAQR